MIYSIDGNLVTIDGNLFERRLNTLTFTTSGSQFPMWASNDYNYAYQYVVFVSNIQQTITINYGDGTVSTFLMQPNAGKFEARFSHKDLILDGNPATYYPKHIYLDGNTGQRFITVKFDFLSELSAVEFRYVILEGVFPSEVNFASKLDKIIVNAALNLTTLPASILDNKSLTVLDLTGGFKTVQNKIPDAVFDLNLITFSASGVFNLSDSISSNLFKINQFKTTLKTLALGSSNIQIMPDEVNELLLLENLGIRENPMIKMPLISNLSNLYRLEIGQFSVPFVDNNWGDLSNLHKLNILSVRTRNMNFSNLHNDWKYLYSLKTLGLFESFVDSNARFNEFIDALYLLVTSEASITPNGSPAPYQNRFRNMSWGHSSRAFTGTKTAPAGYVQGVSNGTPSNQGEKVYVLQNQYNHVITHG